MPVPAATYLLGHRAHDSRLLIRRWKALSRAAGLRCESIHQTSGGPVLLVRSKTLKPGALYLSAGVHGDEPAPPLALVEWAEASISRLGSANIFLLPCFNPAGVMRNTRADENGIDLNRSFHDASLPHIAAWQNATAGLTFSLGLCLHEDYDAQGLYAYELNTQPPHLADTFLKSAEKFIPRDSRKTIEGSSAKHAIINRRHAPTGLPGLPEAIALYPTATPITVTFESPSEYSLYDRVRAHRAVIDRAFEIYGTAK